MSRKRIPFRVIGSLFVCVGTAGCAAEEVATADTVLVWSGWNHTWAMLSHRVTNVTAIMNEDGSFNSGLIGGDWSTGAGATDYPTYRFRWQEVTAHDLVAVHGDTVFTIGPEGEQVIDETLDSTLLQGADQHAVLLRGWSLDTDVEQTADYPDEYDPGLGYTSKGMGVGVSAPTFGGDGLTFSVRAAAHWGPAGDEDPLDREAMNAAIPEAQVGMTVAWTVIGFSGDLAIDGASSSIDYDQGTYSDQPPLGAGDLDFDLSGTMPGFLGLTSFDLDVDVQDDPDQGEYLRSVGVELLPGDVCDTPLEVQAEATNSSLIETAAITFSPSVEVAWISLADAGADVVTGVVEGEHDVGFLTVDTSE